MSMADDLSFTAVGYEPMQAEWWPVLAASFPKPWPREAAMMDLRWWRGQELATRALRMRRVATMPGRPALALRWGWTDWAVKSLLRAEPEWMDPRKADSASEPPARRQPAASEPPARETTNAGNTEETASPPPARRQPAASEPPRARVDTVTPITEAQGSEIPTGGASATADAAPDAPTYPTWLPKAPDRPALLAAVIGCVEELRQAPVNPARCATDAREVLGLWSATGKPPPAEFAADLRLVIRAARACPHRLFARNIRAEGWAEGTDRQRSLATICRRDRWGERLEVARAWEAGSVDVGASQAARTPTPTRAPTATNSLVADALARLRRTPADPAPEPSPRLILNGDS